MIASGTVLLVLAAASAAIGRAGVEHREALVGTVGDADVLRRRRHAIRTGSIAALATATLLFAAAMVSFVVGVSGR